MDALFAQFNAIYPMSDGLQEFLAAHLKRRELKRGEFLVKKGNVNTVGSFLNSGLLHCYYPENDKKITSWFVQEKNLSIAVGSFFSQEMSYESIQAMQPCELFYLTSEELQTAYTSFLELNFIIREMLQVYYRAKEQHTYQLQRGTIKDRFDWFTNTFSDLVTIVPMKYIATFLGVAEETLSRIRSAKS